ncbi:MAG: hypothetical protein WCS37_10775, partial [Chloroflexota bacterium]
QKPELFALKISAFCISLRRTWYKTLVETAFCQVPQSLWTVNLLIYTLQLKLKRAILVNGQMDWVFVEDKH